MGSLELVQWSSCPCGMQIFSMPSHRSPDKLCDGSWEEIWAVHSVKCRRHGHISIQSSSSHAVLVNTLHGLAG